MVFLYEVNNIGYGGYDTYDAMLVWAKDATEACVIASVYAKDGGAHNWEATEVNNPGEAGILLASFNAG